MTEAAFSPPPSGPGGPTKTLRPRDGRRLGLCLAAALGLHALAAWVPLSHSEAGGGPSARPAASPPLELRLVAALPQAPTRQDTGALESSPAPAAIEAAALREEMLQQELPPKKPMQMEAPPAERATGPAAPAAAQDGESPGLQFAQAGHYVPSDWLDEAPRLPEEQKVRIQHPDDALPEGQGRANAALLLNAQGGVDAVLVPGEQLPRRFARAIQKAFEGQRFLPGRKGEQELAARICLAIQFREGEPPRWETRPSPAAWRSRSVTAEDALASCAP